METQFEWFEFEWAFSLEENHIVEYIYFLLLFFNIDLVIVSIISLKEK